MFKFYSQRETIEYITVLKVIACILITNSHCKAMYPISFFAIGGTFGNAIFFVVSGYCLANVKLNFEEWYKKRLKRIMPSLLIIILIDVILVQKVASISKLNVLSFCSFYINRYWFVFGIFLCYIGFYFLMQLKTPEKACLALWGGMR